VITLSDKGSKGEREDRSGPLLVELLERMGARVEIRDLLPDDQEQLSKRLQYCADTLHLDMVVTTGGTGLAPRDRTPEATSAILDRRIPGMEEVMRMKGLASTPRAVLSRGVAGVRGETLIINFPGSVKAVKENFEAIRPVIHHAIELIHGSAADCGSPDTP
jgi:molybdenum cofactor synthesis domain-containing protein